MTELDPISYLRALDPATDERVDRHLDAAARSRIENMTRDLLADPDPAPRRSARIRSPRRVWTFAVATAAAAGIVIVVLALSSTDYEPSGPLAGFASTAAAQEPLTPFEYVDWAYDWENGEGIDRRLQIWAGADERFERRRFSLDGSRAGGDAIYTSRELGVQCTGAVSGDKIRCVRVESLLPPPVEEMLRRQAAALRKAGKEILRRQPGGVEKEGVPDGADPPPIMLPVDSLPPSLDDESLWEGLWLQAPGLPTDPDELRAVLEEQIAGEFERGISSSNPTTGPAEGTEFSLPVGPLAELPEKSRSIVLREGLFSKLTAILSHPFTLPELRASAFELLGALPTVSVGGEGGDSVRIILDRPQLGPGGPAGLESYELEIDPETTQVLALTRSARYGKPGKVRYERLATETFLERRAVGELPAEVEPFRRAAELYEPDR